VSREREGRIEQLRGVGAALEALAAGREVGLLLLEEGADEPGLAELLARAERAGVPVRRASAAVLRRMTSIGPPARVLALLGRDPRVDLDRALLRRGAIWVLCGLGYPTNAGMAIRTAEGSGAEAVVIDAEWDHEARRAAVRASMRADWYMPVFYARTGDVLERARAAAHRIYAIENSGDRAPWEVDLRGACVFLVGGERHGLPERILARCDATLRLPMAGFIPSYNVQAAVAAVALERLRQTQPTPDP
jgi:tRNA G18 (ribose-2'-O)-methylase SpoU